MLPQSEHQPITPLSAAAMETVTYFVVFHKASTCLVEKEPAEKLFAARALDAHVAELLGLGSGMGFLGPSSNWVRSSRQQLQAATSIPCLRCSKELGGTPSYLNHHGKQILRVSGILSLHRFQFFYVFNPLKLGVMLMLLPERTSS